MCVSVKLSFLDLHFCTYLLIYLRYKFSAQVSFLWITQKQEEENHYGHLLIQLIRISMFMHGEILFYFFSAWM